MIRWVGIGTVLIGLVAYIVYDLQTLRLPEPRGPQVLSLPAHLLDGLEEAELLVSPLIGVSGMALPTSEPTSRVTFDEPESIPRTERDGVEVHRVLDDAAQGPCLEVRASPSGRAQVSLVLPSPAAGFLEVGGKIRVFNRMKPKELAEALRRVRRLPAASIRATPSGDVPASPTPVKRESHPQGPREGTELLPDKNAVDIFSFANWQSFSTSIVVPESSRAVRLELDVDVPLFSVRFDDLYVKEVDPLSTLEDIGRYRYAGTQEVTAPLKRMMRCGDEDRLSLLALPKTHLKVRVALESGSRFETGVALWSPPGLSGAGDQNREFECRVTSLTTGAFLSRSWVVSSSDTWRQETMDLSFLGKGEVVLELLTPPVDEGRAPPYLVLGDPRVSAPRDESEPIAGMVLLTVDALSWDHVHGAGYPRATTPNLNRLMSEGVAFDRATAPSPSTYTSMPSILASAHRRDGWDQFSATLSAQTYTFPMALTEGGFLVKPFIADYYFNSFYKGFYSRPFPHNEPWQLNEEIDERLIAQFGRWLGEVRDRRFFAWIHTNQPHGPNRPYPEHDLFRDDPEVQRSLEAIAQYRDEHGVQGTRNLNEAAEQISLKRKQYPKDLVAHAEVVLTALYDGSIHQADGLIQEVVNLLEREGVYEKTLLVISSDHGWPLWTVFNPDYNVPEGELVVPLVLRGPGVPAGRRIAQRVSTIDIGTTLLAAAGIESSHPFEGIDLSALYESTGDFREDLVPAQRKDKIVGYQGPFKLVVTRDLFEKDDELDSDRAWLYDLEEDPMARHDVLADHWEEAASILSGLRAWHEEGLSSFQALPLSGLMKDHMKKAGYMPEDG